MNKNPGNDEYWKNELSSSAHFSTEGLNVNCKDEELNAQLYISRAKAHFSLGEIVLFVYVK